MDTGALPVQLEGTEMDNWRPIADRIARYSRAGYVDPAACTSLANEWVEMHAESDPLRRVMEAGDCLYYIGKAEIAGLFSAAEADDTVERLIAESGFDLAKITTAMDVKYALRQQTQRKDHTAEGNAVRSALGW
jgi:hypothetical protein